MVRLALCGGEPVRTRPYPPWPQAGPEERQWVEQVLAGHRWFAGPRGDDPEALGTLFGERFAALHGACFGLPVANGSVAIEIALRAAGIGPGDEVIVPAYTFVSTATSVLMVGAIPIFADIDSTSYCLDPEDASRRIGPRTRAILPVHLGGHMADMHGLGRLARENGLVLVEDCAQAIAASWGGRKAGTWGALGTFSFQANKTITAGEGGLVVTDDPDLADRVVALRAFGRVKGGPVDRSSALISQWLSSNYRLSELQAAVLLAQLERFPSQDARRQANAARLTKGLQEIPGVRHIRVDAPHMKHGYYYYLVRYEPGTFGNLTPERMCQALNAEGIPFVPGDREPLYHHPVFRTESFLECYRRAVDSADPPCRTVEEACRCTIILRHQTLLGEPQDMDDIIEALWKLHRNVDELS